MRRKTTWHRSRTVCLIDEDIRKLSDALAERFPQARYYMEPTDRQRNYLYPLTGEPLRKHPPPVLIHSTLFRIWQSARRWDTNFIMALNHDWRPMWSRCTDTRKNRYWYLLEPEMPYVWFRFLSGVSSPMPGVETLPFFSDITVFCRPHDKRDLQFAGLFFRLFGKLASDRNLAWVGHPGGGIREVFVDRTAWRWVGHEARRWALENPHRYLLLLRGKDMMGLRPLAPHQQNADLTATAL
jgi:hypothetical protein